VAKTKKVSKSKNQLVQDEKSETLAYLLINLS